MSRSVKPSPSRAALIGARVAAIMTWVMAVLTLMAFIWLVSGRISMATGSQDMLGPLLTTVISFGVVLLSFVTILFAFATNNAPIRHLMTAVGVAATLSAVAALFGM